MVVCGAWMKVFLLSICLPEELFDDFINSSSVSSLIRIWFLTLAINDWIERALGA
jgi:hypothetical protein